MAARTRMATLDVDATALLSAAAVLGDRFDFADLCELVDAAGADVSARLSRVVSARIVVPNAHNAEFSFVHPELPG